MLCYFPLIHCPRSILLIDLSMTQLHWTGNTQSVMATLNASSHSPSDRETNDYYATPPNAVIQLMQREKFSHNILEPACGEGHISQTLELIGHKVLSSDLIDRHY